MVGIAVLGISIAAVPADSQPASSHTQAKKKPKKVSQEITWKQAMQLPGFGWKTRKPLISNLNRMVVDRVLVPDPSKRDHFPVDVSATLYSTLGTDAVKLSYWTHYAMIRDNQIWEDVQAKRVGIVWTPLGRCIKWTAQFKHWDWKKKEDDYTDAAAGVKGKYYRYSKVVDGKEVPEAVSLPDLGTGFTTYKRGLIWYQNVTKKMGE